MNRLYHFLHAKTQYGLHSPFVYRLYTECLFSRAGGYGRHYADVVWRLEHYYGARFREGLLHTSDGVFQVVEWPHRDEAAWRAVVNDPRWQATIDLFTVGIAVANPRLTKQHFLLR